MAKIGGVVERMNEIILFGTLSILVVGLCVTLLAVRRLNRTETRQRLDWEQVQDDDKR